MNYTTNYHLPQWAETDRIMMEDFNEAMTALDQGIKTAQDTADTAESKADAAQTTANSVADAYTPDNKPYVIGTYSGNDGTRQIELGFQPSLVIAAGDTAQSEETGLLYTGMFSPGSSITSGSVESYGFKVSSVSGYYPNLNARYVSYRYIAFR